jgi:hypothetical protein
VQRSYTRRLARLLIVITGSALAVPAAAQAHHTAVPLVALDYRNRITTVAGAGVHASLEDAGRRLQVFADPAVKVVVLGLTGEPLLRFTRGDVAVNRGSLTALAERLTGPPAATGGVSWLRISRGHSFTWADTRAATPSTAARSGSEWVVPILVNGQKGEIAGEFIRLARPPVWPWILLAGLPLVGGAALIRRRLSALPATIALGAVAAAATLATLAGFAAAELAVSTEG